MMQSEFETIYDNKIDPETFLDIEMVYMYYPGIDTKEQIVTLYQIGGKALIADLLPRAIKIKNIEEVLQQNRIELEALNKGY